MARALPKKKIIYATDSKTGQRRRAKSRRRVCCRRAWRWAGCVLRPRFCVRSWSVLWRKKSAATRIAPGRGATGERLIALGEMPVLQQPAWADHSFQFSSRWPTTSRSENAETSCNLTLAARIWLRFESQIAYDSNDVISISFPQWWPLTRGCRLVPVDQAAHVLNVV